MLTYLRAGTALCLVMAGTQVMADCSPTSPNDGDVITCTGTDTNGVNQDLIGNGNLDDIDLTVTSGAIVNNTASGAEHVVALDDDAEILVENGGLIESFNDEDAIHLDNGGTVTVASGGTVNGSDDAIQGDDDLTVVNNGEIFATDEGVNAEDDAQVTNNAGARIRALDDAVKVGQNAVIINHGEIRNIGTDPLDTQDAIDIDSGTILNTGIIRSNLDAAIDFDENGSGGPAAQSAVNNSGTIRGTVGVLTDDDNTASQRVVNEGRGRIIGDNGVAIDLGKGDDEVALSDTSWVFGDILLGEGRDTLELHNGGASVVGDVDFGKGNDLIKVYADAHWDWLYGDNSSTFYGGLGIDTIEYVDYSSIVFTSNNTTVSYLGGETYEVNFFHKDTSIFLDSWEKISFSDGTFDLSDFVAPVPLPAGGVLMLSALFGLGAIRRRSRKAA